MTYPPRQFVISMAKRYCTAVTLLSVACCIVQSLSSRATHAQATTEPVILEFGKPVEREIRGGEKHVYQLQLEARQFLQIEVMQLGADVSITLFDPANNKVAESALPHGPAGPETIFSIVGTTGAHRLEVSTAKPNAPAGRYQAKIVQLRSAAEREADVLAGERLLGEGLIASNQGTTASIRLAIAKFEALALLVQDWPNHLDLAAALNNIGQNHNLLGEWQQALEYYQRSLATLRATPDDGSQDRITLEGIALGGVAIMNQKLGDAGQALRYYQEAVTLMQRGGNQRNAALRLGNIASIYSEMGEFQLALTYNARALEMLQKQNAPAAEAVTLASQGAIQERLGNLAQAVKLYEQALAKLQANNISREQPAFLHLLGKSHHALGDRVKALAFLNSALAGARTSGDRSVEGAVLDSLGVLFGAQGETQKAFQSFASALLLQRAIEHKAGEERTLYHQAQLARDTGQLNDAYGSITAALAIVEARRAKIRAPNLRASFLATAEDYYELAIDILMRLHEADPTRGYDSEALQLSERERARTLIEVLAEARYDLRGGADAKLVQREQLLQQQISATAERLQRLTSTQAATATVLQKDLETLRGDYQKILADLRALNPHYAALTYPQPLNLREIQTQVLDGDSLLLEYALGEKRSLLAAVTREHFELFTLPGRAEIETTARRFYGLLTARNTRVKFETVAEKLVRTAQAEDELPRAAAALSKILLGPVADQLGHRQLLIVADGALQYIPFGAITVPHALEKKPGTRDTPLVAEHEIVSLPSASTLAVLRRELGGRQAAPKLVAVLADPVFGLEDQRFQQARRPEPGNAIASLTSRRRTRTAEENTADELTRAVKDVGAGQEFELSRLPYTRHEALAISALVPPSQREVALDFVASRAAATSAGLSQYRIIHLATHGFLNSTHPELSGLVFSLVDEKGQPINGFLRTHEIFNLKLPAELVVLSGCRTGLGQEIRGEGLVGLTRGFMYAGAARVMVSLWDVQDEATAELMKRFYQGLLKTKLSPAAALRAAQVSMVHDKRWSSPYYWAGFTLQGEPR